MVSWLELLLIAVSPSLFLLWFFHHKDRYKSEPIWFMGKVFIRGALSIIPALIVQLVFDPVFQPEIGRLEAMLSFFIIVGPMEEFSTFGAGTLEAYQTNELCWPKAG